MFSSISRPLDVLSNYKSDVRCTAEMETALEKLRQFIKSNVILAHLYNSTKYVIGTNASDFGLGALIA